MAFQQKKSDETIPSFRSISRFNHTEFQVEEIFCNYNQILQKQKTVHTKILSTPET